MPTGSALRALLLTCLYATATGTNYTNHGPVLGVIAAQFGLSAAVAGTIATAYFAGSAATMLMGGALADRFGAHRMVSLGFGLIVICNLACGLASPNYPILLAWRFVGGIGTGLSFAAGSAYLREMVGPGRSHFALGSYGAAFLLGSASPFLFMPSLAGPGHDWRLAYTLSGAVVGLCYLVWLLGAPAQSGQTHGPRPGPADPLSAPARSNLRAAMSARNSWLLALCHTCGFGLAMVLGTWIASYLIRNFGLDLVTAGALGSLVLVMGIVGRFVGGIAVERGFPPVAMIRGSLVLAALGLVAMAGAGDRLPIAVAGVIAAGLGVGLPFPALFEGAAASVPSSPASAQALVGWAGTVVAVIGPPLVGGLLDLTGGFPAGFVSLALFTLAVLATTRWLLPFSEPPAGGPAQELLLSTPW